MESDTEPDLEEIVIFKRMFCFERSGIEWVSRHLLL